MDEWQEKFRRAVRRDVQFFSMMPAEFNGEPVVEIMVITELGTAMVLRVENPDWFTSVMRGGARTWGASREDD